MLISACGASAVDTVSTDITAESFSKIDLADTIWSGIETVSGDEYILSFDTASYSLTVINDGTENKYEGTYELSDEGIIINGLEVIKDPKNIFLNIDGDNFYLVLDDVVLTPSNGKDIERIAEELGAAKELNELLNSGYCWIACSNGQALILYVNGDESTLKTVASLGEGKVAVQEVKGSWSLNETDFSIYTENGIESNNYEWEIDQEEDVVCINLVGEGLETSFYQTKVTSVEEAINLANKYIINQTSVDEIEDITYVLDGYEGVSIVDGFIFAGLEPSFGNRSIFAEKAGIEGYIGTAEQNMFLIEYMGGIVK